MSVSGTAIGRFGAWATAAGALLLAGFLASCGRTPTELVVYSSRNEQLIKPMFDRQMAFNAATSITGGCLSYGRVATAA